MKILSIHNKYKIAGGENKVFRAEMELLNNMGNYVDEIIVSNDSISNFYKEISTGISVVYSNKSKKLIHEKIIEFEPDIVHVHNFFPLLTPSIYDPCIENGVPVIQTLHNYRIICARGLLMRKGKICEECLKGSPYRAVMHRCYNNSLVQTFPVARMIAYHRNNHTWVNKVNRFIALTKFCKDKFVQAGIPTNKIVVKPNFYIKKWNNSSQKRIIRSGILYVGRLSIEKGVITMIEALKNKEFSIRIAGDGPLMVDLKSFNLNKITFLGELNDKQISKEMSVAAFLVMPSECYETFGMVLIESFAHGLPVLASKLGAMVDIVEDGVTGIHFEPGDKKDLAMKMQWMLDNPDECRRMGKNARKVYLEKYSPDKNYEILMKIYKDVIEEFDKGKF